MPHLVRAALLIWADVESEISLKVETSAAEILNTTEAVEKRCVRGSRRNGRVLAGVRPQSLFFIHSVPYKKGEIGCVITHRVNDQTAFSLKIHRTIHVCISTHAFFFLTEGFSRSSPDSRAARL